jgi:hypothetical protein
MDILARQVIALHEGANLPNADRLNRLGRVINWVIKVRGWKAVGMSIYRPTSRIRAYSPSSAFSINDILSPSLDLHPFLSNHRVVLFDPSDRSTSSHSDCRSMGNTCGPPPLASFAPYGPILTIGTIGSGYTFAHSI